MSRIRCYDRDQQMLDLYRTGATLAEIADQLDMTVSNVAVRIRGMRQRGQWPKELRRVHPVPLDRVRAVWAAISANPQASYRTIGRPLGMSVTEVRSALRWLIRAEYIFKDDGLEGAIRVDLPLLISSEIRIVQVPAKEMRHAA